MERNDALCRLIPFKEYKPSADVREFYVGQHSSRIRWYHIPNVGNFNNYELKFHCDYNWLISAALEFKKYRGLDAVGSYLHTLYSYIEKIRVLDINQEDLWFTLTDYALELLHTKQKQAK